jgi:sodium/potassium-transporting ATPase subunit alpha
MLLKDSLLSLRCAFILDPASNSTVPLNEPLMARLTATQEKWAGKGQRVLLLARRVIRAKDLPEDIKFDGPDFGDYVNEELNQELTIVGLVGLVDPPRDDIPEVSFLVA